MEKIITGSGKQLQKEVNRWLNKDWKITRLESSKQVIYDSKIKDNKYSDTFNHLVNKSQPVSIETNGSSIQNLLIFYDYFLVVLEKKEK